MQCYDSGSLDAYYNRYWGGSRGTVESVSKKWDAYRKINKDAYLYSFDLNSYGTSQTHSKQKNVVQLNGWSDKILDFINLVEKQDVMESQIKKW